MGHTCSSSKALVIVEIVLVGPCQSGKTLFSRALKHKVNGTYRPTIGVEFSSHLYPEDDLKVYLYDTSGAEYFRNPITCYFNKDLIVIVYTDDESFNYWKNLVKEYEPYKRIQGIRNEPVDEPVFHDQWISFDFTSPSQCRDVLRQWVMPKVAVKKPAVYLYGPDGQSVTVRLATRHLITFERPARTSEGVWVCTPSEKKINQCSSRYIYWEGEIPVDVFKSWSITHTLFIRGQEYKLLSKILSILLSEEELADFDEYWESIITYYTDHWIKVDWIDESDFHTAFPLVCEPAMTATARIELIFTLVPDKSYDPIDITYHQQKLSTIYPQLTSGFRTQTAWTYVEWGGIGIFDEEDD